ncbi:MAG: hypothetical protein NC343_04855 [Muribaculum sp.]|nr:hypothetical protein [Muribaculum sp.]
MTFLQFADKSVPYKVFVDDVAARVVSLLKSDDKDPDYISQRRAFEIFGRRNVERWRRLGKIKPSKRPGKVEYKTSELRLLQRVEQDYFDR